MIRLIPARFLTLLLAALFTLTALTACHTQVDLVGPDGFHHQGYYDEHHDWHGGYYDQDRHFHDDPHDWHN